MGRVYYVNVSAVAITAATDLFEIKAATGKAFALRSLWVGQTSDVGDAAAENLQLQVKRATGGFTTGTSGSAGTLVPANTNSPAAGATAKITQTGLVAAGTGALTQLMALPFSVEAGYSLPKMEREERFIFQPTEALVISLPAPADSLTVSACVGIEELQ